jgi:hypothetical protein
MRASCFVVLMLAANAAEAGTCRWQDSEGWSALNRKSSIIQFERTWVCSADASGTLEVKLFAVRGRKKTELESEKSEVKPRGKWDQKKKVTAKAFPYGSSPMCEEKPKKAKRVMRVFDHELHAAFPVTVRAEVTGTGDMAALAMKEDIQAYCRLCERGGGGLSIKWGRAGASAMDKKAVYTMSVDKAKFACLKPGATLELRYFVSDDKKEIGRAIQPAMVETGLERKFKLVKGKMVFEAKPPVAKLCRFGKGYVGLEFGGKGELHHIDSNRRVLPLRCK